MPQSPSVKSPETPRHRVRADWPFYLGLILLGGSYVLLILITLLADVVYVWWEVWFNNQWPAVRNVLVSDDVWYAAKLSVLSSTVTTILSLWVAVPIGYLLSRFKFPGRALLDAILDIPIVLPPLVIGVSLLILFKTGGAFSEWLAGWSGIVLSMPIDFPYAIPGVILAQFLVAAAFAVRAMRLSFDEIPFRKEEVALTLGCTRGQAFWRVVLPEARGGLLAAATLTWARSLGEFGPILVFAGATPKRTEVLPTSVFLQFSVGDLIGAVTISLGMVLIAVVVLVVVRVFGHRDLSGRALR
jgi:molybdate transport system permease protein